jgi:hypothetical protein
MQAGERRLGASHQPLFRVTGSLSKEGTAGCDPPRLKVSSYSLCAA